jgi:hypothetical protein
MSAAWLGRAFNMPAPNAAARPANTVETPKRVKNREPFIAASSLVDA